MSSIQTPLQLLPTPKPTTIAKKPLSKQLSRGGGRFTCGHCSRQFKRRFSLKRHVAIHARKKIEKFGDTDPRFRHLEKELHLRMRSAKTSAPPATLFKVRGGRRKLSEYLCKGCPRKFETYNKKRDHQKNCILKKRDVSVLVSDAVPEDNQHVLGSICTL